MNEMKMHEFYNKERKEKNLTNIFAFFLAKTSGGRVTGVRVG